MTTSIEAAQDEARKLGIELDADQADYILWEHTGFPHWWDIPKDGDTPEACMRKQVREYLKTKDKDDYYARTEWNDDHSKQG